MDIRQLVIVAQDRDEVVEIIYATYLKLKLLIMILE